MPAEIDGLDEDWIELADAIAMVRRQLADAAARKPADGPVLSVGKVVLEFSGELKKSAGVSGGFKFWVVSGDAKGERSESAGQKVTVELVPGGGGGLDVLDRVAELPAE